MARRRVIPTLLTDGVSLVKGERFQSWRTVGMVVAAARVFSMRDVDELTLLDVRATRDGRTISPTMVTSVAEQLTVPLSVGGGVRTLANFEATLRAGADKVVLGTAALDLSFVAAASQRFGAQAVVASIDLMGDDTDEIAVESGSRPTGLDAVEFAQAVVAAGAGEILLQTVSRDGMLVGMNVGAVERVSAAVTVPVIASSGAGSYDDLAAALTAGADAVSAGGMFQFTEQTPKGARDFLADRGVDVRVAD